MANLKFTNFAATTLASGISAGATSLTVQTGAGSLFPSLSGSEYFYITLVDAATGLTREIVKCTARSTDTLTVTRAQEGTSASAFLSGDKVELRLTAAGLNTLATTETAQTFTGDQTITGNINTSGDITLTGAGKGIVFEGTTADAHETTLTGGEPTADRTITLADNSGVVDPEGYTTTVTAAGTTTLTTASSKYQFFTGSTTQTVVLPVTSTLFTGKAYAIINNSTGQVTVQSSGGNTILVLGPQSAANFICILTSGTTAASWENVAIGYKNIPFNSQSAAYTTVISDAGKCIFHPSTDANARTFTIDSNANVPYPVGTAITFINMTSQVVTIAITSDTMYLSSAGTTGSRSLAQYGVATAIKMTSTTWIINGSGLT